MTPTAKLLLPALLALPLAFPATAERLPGRTSDARVHDLSGTLGPAAVADLERRAEAVERAGATVAVLVRLERADSEETEEDARRLLEEWKVESEPGRRDGLAIVVNLRPKDSSHGSAAIRAGRSLVEGNLPRRELRRIWSDEMRPRLKAGRIVGGIGAGLDAAARSLREGPPPPTPSERAAADLASGTLLPVALGAGILGIVWAVRLGTRRAGDPIPSSARTVALGPARGGSLARGRVTGDSVLAGLLDLADRGAVNLEAVQGGELLARPADRGVTGAFENAVLSAVVSRAETTGVAELGTAPFAAGRLTGAAAALRADLVDRGLFDPFAPRRRVLPTVAGAALVLLAATLLVASAVGGVPESAIVSLAPFGAGFALLVRAATLRETTPDGEREAAAWRAWLSELVKADAEESLPVDLPTALPFLLAAGRTDVLRRRAEAAAAAGVLPAWIAPAPVPGGDGSELVPVWMAVAAASDGGASAVDAGAGTGAGASGSF